MEIEQIALDLVEHLEEVGIRGREEVDSQSIIHNLPPLEPLFS